MSSNKLYVVTEGVIYSALSVLFVMIFFITPGGSATISKNFGEVSQKVTDHKVASFNLRSQIWDKRAPESYGPWATRFSGIKQIISEDNPDIIGFQEVVHATAHEYISNQRRDLQNFMKDNGYECSPIQNGMNNSPLCWKTSRYETLTVKEQKILRKCSKCAYGPAPRFLSYVKLEDKNNGRVVSVFNYHFNQFRGQDVQAPLLKSLYEDWSKNSNETFLTGDWNDHDHLLTSVTDLVRVDTFGGVDHILAPRGSVVTKKEFEDSRRGYNFSDHKYVSVVVE